MDYTCIFFGILFTVTGILFFAGKLHNHIHAWKNMPEEEKKKVRIVPLYRNIGEIIGLSGVIFLVKGFWPGFKNHWFTVSMVAWLIIAGLDFWYIQKSSRYQEK